MSRLLPIALALATVSTAHAQYAAQPVSPAGQPAYNQPPSASQVTATQPAQGVWLRTDSTSSVKTISASANSTEIRVEHGRANIQVSQAAPNAQILIDLPGGQTSLIKDGLYTFNADTNTVRVLRGEADAYLDANAKPIKVKEDHQVIFGTGAVKSVDVDPRMLASDVLPGDRNGEGYPPRRGYQSGPYGDGGYYGYPAYPYYAYGYGYPYYGYGYPFGFGAGFGYYGGFGGGFRGGFRR